MNLSHGLTASFFVPENRQKGEKHEKNHSFGTYSSDAV